MKGDSAKARDSLGPMFDGFKERFESNKRILSFTEYLDHALENPALHCRDAATFVRDAFDHYGSFPVERPWGQETRFALFDLPFDDGKDLLIGQEAAQQAIYQLLCAFVQEGRVDRLVVLNGPNGSAKTTLVTCIMRALEHFSTTPEGALYSINWVFPSHRTSSTRIGFSGERPLLGKGDSYAHLTDEDVDARLRCEVRDHPLLLLPVEERRQDVKEAAERIGAPMPRLPILLERGDLCHKCKLVSDALLTAYHGDLSRVLQHVQVERWFVSRAYRRGAVSIGPQLSVDAGERQISADRSLAALPASLQMTTLFEPHGELVDAAGGILEFSDLLKRPLDAFRYLLGTIETGEVNLNTSILRLNTVLMATTNDVHLAAFREHPDYASFKGRFAVVRVPYIRHHETEQRIYDTRVIPNVRRHVSPHATEVAARWAVLTRLKRPDASKYEKKVRSMVETLTVAEKSDLYSSGKVPAAVRGERADELRARLGDLYHESDHDVEYEGRYGASPREIRAVILGAAHDDGTTCLSPRVVIDHLVDLCGKKIEHSFLRRKPLPGGYEASEELLEVVRDSVLDAFEDELRAATGLVAEERHAELFERYVFHIRHWVKDEKIFNKVTGKDEAPDLNMMASVEERLDVPRAEVDGFRKALIAAIAGFAIEHPGQPIEVTKIFPDHLTSLRASYFQEHREMVAKVGRNVLALLAGDKVAPEEDAAVARTALETLRTRFGYCDVCAGEALSDLVQLRFKD
jgi:predicted Ser/Thr protein kinase